MSLILLSLYRFGLDGKLDGVGWKRLWPEVDHATNRRHALLDQGLMMLHM